MAKIIRPEGQTALTGTQISRGTAGVAGAGLGEIGREVATAADQLSQDAARAQALTEQTGLAISRESERYFEESKRAHNSAVLSRAISDASIEFYKAKEERYNRSVDEDGNPLFTTLSDDIASIGNDIRDKISSRIADPETQAAFKNQFLKAITNEQITAMGIARTQQQQFANQQYQQAQMDLVSVATQDRPENVDAYIQQGLENAENHGLGIGLTSEQIEEEKAAFKTIVLTETIKNQSQTDPVKAKQIKEAVKSELPDEVQANLDEQIDIDAKTQRRQAEKAELQAQEDAANRESDLVQEVTARIKAGAMLESEVVRLEGMVSDSNYNKLLKLAKKESDKQLKELQEQEAIARSIAETGNADAFTSSKRDKSYQKAIKRVELDFQRELSLSERAAIAHKYGSEMGQFSQEVGYALTHGNVDQSEDALAAYTYVKDLKGRALDSSKFSKEAESIAVIMERSIILGQRSPQDALANARERVLHTDSEIVKRRNLRYNALLKNADNPLSIRNAEETVADYLDLENIFLINEEVPDEVVQDFITHARDGFEMTDDEDEALEYATRQMNKTYGHSEFFEDEKYMKYPVEKIYPNVDLALMKKQLSRDLQGLLPKDMTVEDIELVGDNSTIRTKTYTIRIPHIIDGIDVGKVLTNDEGEVIRWPDVRTLHTEIEGISKELAEKALKREQEAIETKFSDLP